MDTSLELAAVLPARPSVSGRAKPEVSVPPGGRGYAGSRHG